ncbi:MAG: polymerase [Treponema sp.]|nr:polymerase [Treponema sp.]
MKRIYLAYCLILSASLVFAQANIGISGSTEWDKMEINATVSLDLASAGFRLPVGRMQGETLITSEYPRLILPSLLALQIDSSSIMADLVQRGEWDVLSIKDLALQARTIPPALSPDLVNLLGFYTLDIAKISAALIRHNQPTEIPRTLSPVSAPAYTGIVIIAAETLPIHGMRSTALLRPCLFPKIWDTEMNLIFERNMLNPRARLPNGQAGTMARYFPIQTIFAGGPSGLSPEITAVVGDRPLRIFARGVFGIQPTDPVIGREDALTIISSEANRSLLREGRVAIILDDSVLKSLY